MFVPVLLLFLATLSAAVMAYGTNASWAQYGHGYDFILFARRFQWPMASLSLLLCLVLLGLVISGRKRAWWLIGLGPVLALFAHRFATDPGHTYLVVEDPTFVTAAEAAAFVKEDDWVVGLQFADHAYAYPYAALFGTPVVIHAEHDRRIAVMWSSYANRAIAAHVTRDLRGSDLEVVSMPANAMLVYNRRIGQFINGVTGQTPRGERPDGVRELVPVTKCTWKTWRTRNPETRVLAPVAPDYATAPRAAIRPTNPMPPIVSDLPQESRVVIVGARAPVAVRSELILPGVPVNLKVDDMPVLLLRDPTDGVVRAFERRVDDLRPRFDAGADKRRPNAVMIDADLGAGWDASGRAVDGPKEYRGRRLPSAVCEDGLFWDVMKHWYPAMQLVTPEQRRPRP